MMISSATPGQENPEFVQQYIDAGNAGLIRGAYHSGRPGPGIYDGMSQAKFFVAHGGRWNPYGTYIYSKLIDSTTLDVR